MTFYVSTTCLSWKYKFSEILEIYDRLGIKNVELGICTEHKLNIKKLINKYEFKYLVHHYFPPPKEQFIVNLASRDYKIFLKSMEQIKKSIDFCSDNNINIFSFHAGFRSDPDVNLRFDFNNIQDYDSAYNRFLEALIKLAKYSKYRKVKIAIENNVISDYNLIDGKNKLLLMCELWEFEQLFNEINSKSLGILLDIGHLKVSSNILKFDAEEFIEKLKNKIFAAHLHENNGRVDEHKCPKEGDWSLNIVSRYFQNKDIPIVLECKCNDEKELESYSI